MAQAALAHQSSFRHIRSVGSSRVHAAPGKSNPSRLPWGARMARLICALLPSLLTLAAQTSITFTTVSKEVIERNLHPFQDSNVKREQALHSMFEEAGCTGDQLRAQPLKHVKSPNIICTLPGETDSEFLDCAHTDFVDPGKGGVDNNSGVSLLSTFFTSLN